MQARSKPKPALALACMALISCVGEIGQSEGPPSTPSGLPGPGAGGGGTLTCSTDVLPAPRLRRLSHTQYANSLQKVLALSKAPDVSSFPQDAAGPGGLRVAATEKISPALARYVWETTESIVDGLDPAKFLACRPADADNEACVGDFIARFGRAAWRRPLETVELEEIKGTYRAVKAASGGVLAMRAAIMRTLLSPHFLYRTELGQPDPKSPARRVLTGHEVASELAYLLWDGPPDEALAAVADSGSLVSPTTLRAEVDRMMRPDTGAKEVLRGFFERLLGFKDVELQTKDPALVPLYSPAVMATLGREIRAYLDDVLWAGDGSFKTMLLSDQAYVSPTTARIYGATVTGTGMTKVTLDRRRRLGVLTHPAVIASHSQATETGVVRRGRFLASELLCLTVPEPPPNVDAAAFNMPNPNMTVRERWQAHSARPECAVCHRLFDALGLSLENYDPLGAYRTTEAKRPIDASGDVLFSGSAPPVTVMNAVDLIEKMAARSEVYGCFSRQYFRDVFGRQETAQERCALESLETAFSASGYNVKTLVTTLVGLDGFRFRRSDTQEDVR